MSFLAPWFLLGALAIGAPILFHLIRRNTRERILFSSLMFLSPSPPRLTKRKRIENILLLLLRCAVICSVALAFARPYFHKLLGAAGAPAPLRKYILLLDTSASMRRSDLWKQAQNKALSIIRDLGPGDELAIMSFGGSFRTVFSFDEFSASRGTPQAAADRVRSLTPTWEATHLGAALTAAAEGLQDRQEKVTNSAPASLAIIVISDFQEGSKLDELQHFEWPKSVRVRLEPVKVENQGNAFLQLAVEAESASTNRGVRVLLANSSRSRREQFRLSWGPEGQSNQPLGAIDVYLAPGQKKIVQAPPMPAAGGRLTLTGDDDPFDNSLYVARSSPALLRALYLGNDPREDTRQPFYYLNRAFSGEGGMAAQVTEMQPTQPVTDAFNQSSFVIADAALPPTVIEPLRYFISAGHSMLLVLGKPADLATAQQLLETPGIPCVEAETNRYALLGQIDFQHPLFAPFADPRFSDFSKIRFWRHRVFNAGSIPHARVLARFDDDSPALVEAPLGKGALYILASGWQPVESQLAVSSKFVPLLFSFLDLSSGANAKVSQQFVIGQAVRLPENLGTGGTIVVTTPAGQKSQLSSAIFNETSEPGLYRAVGGTNSFTFAVNLEPAESRTTALPEDELERLGLPMLRAESKSQAASARNQSRLLATELEQHQKLWRWGLVGALLFLAFEALAARPAGPRGRPPDLMRTKVSVG